MTRRFSRFILPWLLFVLIAVLLVIAWTAYQRDRASETAASPSGRPTGAQTASETTIRPPDGSARPLTPVFPPHTAAMGWAPRRLPAGLSDRTATPSPLGARPSSVALDVGSFALPTPLVGFGGLRPIQESWYVGVASGIASWMGEGYGSNYLALPIGPGFRVRICGPGGCAEMVSNDAGPALHMQRAPYNRVADVAVVVWERICGVSRRYGLCPVDLSVLGRG